jgi:hypothetical protein
MSRPLATFVLWAAAIAYFADMFLPWAHYGGSFLSSPRADGWLALPAYWGAILAIGVIVWQSIRLIGVQASRSDAVISAFGGATVGLLAGSGLAYLRFSHYGGPQVVFDYGAWIALVLSVVLVAGSVLELATFDPRVAQRVRRFRLPEVGGE